jgi:ABC-type transporter Mla MlaB component
MAFRVTGTEGEGGGVLRIDGHLDRDSLAELECACEIAQRPITLDLSGLRLADEAALEALVRLERTGTRLIGASQYLELRLASCRRRAGA